METPKDNITADQLKAKIDALHLEIEAIYSRFDLMTLPNSGLAVVGQIYSGANEDLAKLKRQLANLERQRGQVEEA